jgi:hypothetical protein
MSDDPAVGTARATEHNIDLARAFEQMADREANGALKADWQAWAVAADAFREAMDLPNARFGTLDWVRDDWQYLHAGTGLGDDVNEDLVPIDTGAWSALARDDDRDVGFDLVAFLAESADEDGRTYLGFDPGFRAVLDDAEASWRDGVGSEATAYMALVARKLGDAGVLAALPDRAALAAEEQAAWDVVQAAVSDPDEPLSDAILASLVDIQLYAPNGDGLGLVAAPVPGVGTGEYSLVNGWSLAATSWARFAFAGWNPFTDAPVA